MTEEPTDLDLITGHPYQPTEWGDICGHLVNGWPCGFGMLDHETTKAAPADRGTGPVDQGRDPAPPGEERR